MTFASKTPPSVLTPLEERINIFESLFRYSKLHNFFYKINDSIFFLFDSKLNRFKTNF